MREETGSGGMNLYCDPNFNTAPDNLLQFTQIYPSIAILLHMGVSVKASIHGRGKGVRRPRSMSGGKSIRAIPV